MPDRRDCRLIGIPPLCGNVVECTYPICNCERETDNGCSSAEQKTAQIIPFPTGGGAVPRHRATEAGDSTVDYYYGA